MPTPDDNLKRVMNSSDYARFCSDRFRPPAPPCRECERLKARIRELEARLAEIESYGREVDTLT